MPVNAMEAEKKTFSIELNTNLRSLVKSPSFPDCRKKIILERNSIGNGGPLGKVIDPLEKAKRY